MNLSACRKMVHAVSGMTSYDSRKCPCEHELVRI